MPWRETSVIFLRKEFIQLVMNGGNLSRVCENFGISRPTGYKWIHRYNAKGEDGLMDRSRRPDRSPGRVNVDIENAAIEVREKHSSWGGRKIRQRLVDLGYKQVPAASTITAILRRNGRIDPVESQNHMPFHRFSREHPNDLWQMDFKGHVPCPEGRCHPLTILDDCTRYALAVRACMNERTETVQSCLTETFRRYGLPNQIIMDNGAPWGNDSSNPYTRLTVWLMQLSILISHSRPAHPQTLGKDERFHRTFKAELLGEWVPWTYEETQRRFEQWRFCYNNERPHESLGMKTPAHYYTISNRSFPEQIPQIEYGPEDIVRKVQQKGIVHFKGKEFRIPQAFIGEHVALRPSGKSDGSFDVYYVRQRIAVIDLNSMTNKKV